MSVHGVCFDEGMNGNCGLECRGFVEGECNIAMEIVEVCFDNVTEDDWEVLDLHYGIEKEAYESLRKRQIRVSKEEYPWNKSCMPVLHSGTIFFSKE